MEVECKKCKSDKVVKNGIVRGKQRYYCKDCKCNFTEGDKRVTRWHSAKTKRMALVLYLEGMGFRAIERTLAEVDTRASSTAVMNWIRGFGEEIKSLKSQEQKDMDIKVMELDEMWHFVKKKKRNCGSGLHLIDRSMNPLISFWGVEE